MPIILLGQLLVKIYTWEPEQNSSSKSNIFVEMDRPCTLPNDIQEAHPDSPYDGLLMAEESKIAKKKLGGKE